MARYIDADKLKATYNGFVGYDDEIKIIDEIPTEDVLPVIHAKWIDGVCQECGYDGGIDAISGEAKYCARCGAKMDLEEE